MSSILLSGLPPEHLQSLHAASRRGGGRPAERGWAIAAALVAVLLPVALVVLRSI